MNKQINIICTMPHSYNNYAANWLNKIDSNDCIFLIDETSGKICTEFNSIKYTEQDIRRILNVTYSPSEIHWWNPRGDKNIIWFYAHLRMLYFYTRFPNYDYYVFYDDDVFINKLDDFKVKINSNNVDFISYFCFKNDNVLEQEKIPIIDSLTYSKLAWFSRFPGPGDTLPNTDKLFGSFFPIVRFSNSALRYLLDLQMRTPLKGYSEGFVPTVLNIGRFKLDTLYKSDNTSDYFDINDIIVKHKSNKIPWEWL